ncbi:MAG: ATP-binding protein [Jatrophihabitans sp.]|uniref:sensor histidine kinase n=1 Tax=Jatrophihabitans sp. TaxID=1932789 RepID=UPI00390D95BA
MTGPVRQRPWTLRRRIGQSFAVLGALLTLMVTAVVIAATQFVLAGNSVVHRWEPAVATTQRLLTDLVDQETGLRGYALSPDRPALIQYNGSRVSEQAHSRTLRSLIGSDKSVTRRLAAFSDAARQWQADVAQPAIAGIGSGDHAARRLVEGAVAGHRFAAVRARAASLSAAVEDRAASARDRRRTAGTVFTVFSALTALTLVVAGVGLWRGLHRWVLEPVDRLGRQTREVATGDTYREIVADGPAEFTALGRDVEAMRLQIANQLARAEEIQEELRVRSEELARSNDDLQQFAYVASHDLSEPLRKVANFCQLLERQYGPQLDDKARQYIEFAVDGAKRMQVLISDLLALSRVGRTTEEFEAVDLERALASALTTLSDRVDEAGARVEQLTPLPTVAGDRSLLTSLLENLVGNAVKYRREDVPPVVRISAVRGEEDGVWTFTVSDNGIGIDPQYAERIFAVFQRLHLRDRYGGTGIGLALCRKIVEFHGGRIWLDTVESSTGANFTFTIPGRRNSCRIT